MSNYSDGTSALDGNSREQSTDNRSNTGGNVNGNTQYSNIGQGSPLSVSSFSRNRNRNEGGTADFYKQIGYHKAWKDDAQFRNRRNDATKDTRIDGGVKSTAETWRDSNPANMMNRNNQDGNTISRHGIGSNNDSRGRDG